MDREKYMSLALELAREAADNGEVPVGCVIFSEISTGCVWMLRPSASKTTQRYRTWSLHS